MKPLHVVLPHPALCFWEAMSHQEINVNNFDLAVFVLESEIKVFI